MNKQDPATNRVFHWPVSRMKGRELNIGGFTFKGAPNTIQEENDATLRVLFALIDEQKSMLDDISAEMVGENQVDAPTTGNAITDANANLPTTPPADPQVMVRLAEMGKTIDSLRSWVGALQKSYAEVNQRVLDIESKLNIRKG